MALNKELGSLQLKILIFLAENPKHHKQSIQKGIKHPPDQYGSISKAVDALKKTGYIESEEGKSKKGRSIKLYSCTEIGAIYVLTKNQNANIAKILEAYKGKSEVCELLSRQYNLWGHDTTVKFLKAFGKFLSMVEKDGFEKAMPQALSFVILQTQSELKDLSPKKRKEFAKESMEKFPETRKLLKKVKEQLDEIL